MKQFLLIIIVILLSSCFKEDDIIEVHKPGNIQEASVVLGETYSKQVFYDLSSNSIKSSNNRNDWDLAFESDENTWHIRLNYGQMMYAGNSMDTNFSNVTSSIGLKMIFDKSDGNIDSTAIGKWYYIDNNITKSFNYVYVIDRGIAEDYSNIGKKKIQINIENGNYILKYANLDGSNCHSIKIIKDNTYKYIHFSFDDNAPIDIMPPKDTWSLQFTKYSTIIKDFDGYIPYSKKGYIHYSVTGVLINNENIYVALDTNDFFNIELKDTINYQFSNNLDIIGFDWKTYDFDNQLYSILPNRNYIIKNYDGIIYKLRFIDYYNDVGVKGTVSFEIIKL